jgi:hypothetical protein
MIPKIIKLITSSNKYHVELHRTSKSSDLDRLMREGLVHNGVWGSNIFSQSREPSHALGTYRAGSAYGQAVLIFYFPRNEWETERNRLNFNLGTSKLFHYVAQDNNIAIHPRHLVGWIDRENDEFHPNNYPLPREPPFRNFEMEEVLLG